MSAISSEVSLKRLIFLWIKGSPVATTVVAYIFLIF